ncbi:MAG: hypothetical protein COZ06_28005 [Armatimonadetes bacterium CG_4_10_14_3_um_filter_66_18]|nr:hypothetical protein [Armatimonadota bacterium]PIU92508.1 MAG: hypothetical protein COS65_17455 [Armatimonadetes bacterium CG06_land_8_20_14_3_00_66_21]PIX41547.1 MAG: hypothetical protein COZ57_23195 [Armatimonadetes bacterium CG_4_8_14_3_um_filter_66_20]PIY40563.1 MAG: hypothetical protein COZ06_28005 [Armatimonadetes bacterium CG_4_10_14_3_um_filter_66_18]PJB61739.1 MAG: hypothetical protein CO096_27690 [Armatimonadetes bacterium CG_4_9_14_3_um_filter_66_14]
MDLKRTVKQLARKQEVSPNQLLVSSTSNELVRQETLAFFAPVVEQFDEGAFRAALARVPDVPPAGEDQR